MKFGTYFAYWEQDWDTDFVPYCEKVANLGFDLLEINAHGIASMNPEALARFRQAARAAGISVTACVGLTPEFNVASPDETVRQRGLSYMKDILLKMDQLDIRQIGGIIYAYWPVDYSIPFEKERIREISVQSMRELARFAADYGIMLTPEVVNRFEQFLINDSAEAVAYVKDIGMDNVKVMLDTFHMNIEEDSMAGAIHTAGPLLGHFHVGECNRKVPGKGRIPWDEIGQALRDISYNGCVVMEPFVRTGGEVGKDIRVWRDLSGGADNRQLDAEIAESLRFLKDKFVR